MSYNQYDCQIACCEKCGKMVEVIGRFDDPLKLYWVFDRDIAFDDPRSSMEHECVAPRRVFSPYRNWRGIIGTRI